MTYGVTPTGFNRKRLPELLAEIEAAARSVFGAGVIQTPQSPLGQLNGLFADLGAAFWEVAEDTYQSYDPDQAEGVRLDTLAKLRLLERGLGETDPEFRQAITNAGRARIDVADVVRAVTNLTGVTYAQLFVNEGSAPDENGIDGHSLALAVIGGDDEEVARTLRAYVVPGIGTYGNLRVSTSVDGMCRSIGLVRPTVVPVTLALQVRVRNDRMGCPPPSSGAIATGIATDLNGDRRLINGAAVTPYALRSAIESRYANVEFVTATGHRGSGVLGPLPIAMAFTEIAGIDASRINVSVVP